MNSIPISETVSLKSVGLNESWLQDQIWENPTCLGLGELETVTKEHVVSSGGRLDILLKSPIDDSMYEVETMLGKTNPDHIVRTIEYWDLVKRKWPQREHYAVLVAERVTKRFFNVIHILSGAVPLIAIQANIVRSPHGQSLHFTKILDVYEEPGDDISTKNGDFDEAYWAKRSAETLETAKFLQELTKDVYVDCELRFNKYSICIASSSGYIQMRVIRRIGKSVLVGFRHGGKRDEILELLESNGVQYTEQHRRFRFQMPPEMFKEKSDMFLQIAQLNNQWWAD